MQMSDGESHLTVTVPSTSLSQKQEPERLSPQSAFCMMMQLAINLKFLFFEVIFFRIYIKERNYIIADLIGPCLSVVDVVVFVLEMLTDDSVDLCLDEDTNVVKDDLFLLGHEG